MQARAGPDASPSLDLAPRFLQSLQPGVGQGNSVVRARSDLGGLELAGT